MPLFLIKIANSLNAEEVFKTDSLLGTNISIERFCGSNTALNAENCYGFYHSSETCHLKPRCAHCAAEHLTADCTQPKDSSKICSNCNGSHVAYWRGCPVPKERTPATQKETQVYHEAANQRS
ncbi:hypothetical protein CEXT_383051 [Caerostris extrusa]|uniref:Nucleic-acid-binding protein from transposon X-element n=1 Tax=Caerostris extrusa TaxID=172846 RepID=A0AAV4XRF8_CAEEX|nr:hypothetical protein CEXT_383051 [Caerostris extrusa]